jgi:tRNA(fMet)-specific endonuclease VapC
MLRYLLDTNICIYVIKARPRPMLESFNRHAGHMAISARSAPPWNAGARRSG